MEKRITRGVFSSLLFLVLFLSMVPAAQAKLPAQIKDIIARNRPQWDREWDPQKLNKEFSRLLYSYDSFAEEPALLEIFQEEPYSKPSITKEEALADVDFLGALLKYGYAAYQYFGGDAQFLKAKKNIVADLDKEFFPLSAARFIELLSKGLNFINDGHFAIGSQLLVRSEGMYMNLDYAFGRDGHGYYLPEESGKTYLQEVKGQHPEKFIWPSLDKEGKIVYRVGMLGPVGRRELKAEATFLGENGKTPLVLSLTEILGSFVVGEDVYQRYEREGIAVLSVKEFPAWLPQSPGFSRRDHVLMQDFFLDASQLRGLEILILDVRSHRGGDPSQGYSWIRNLTGSLFKKPPCLEAWLRTETAEKLRLLRLARGGHPNYDLYRFYEQLAQSERGWHETAIYLPELIANETVIVVLTDRRTASGGEHFVEALRLLENVVIMGTNTAGSSLGSNASTQLPNSRLKINFGINLRLPLDLVDYEGRGLLPDFWVPPGQALDLAVKFIQNYLH